MTISVIGAGAFGTALAIALAQDNKPVTLYARDPKLAEKMRASRQNPRLPDTKLPSEISITSDFEVAANATIILLAIPAQKLSGVLLDNAASLDQKSLVACCKGIDVSSLHGPVVTIAQAVPSATAAMLTGPSFASDIARGLPTALTLACADPAKGAALQEQLSTGSLRLYRTTDTVGAELGGALKNVIAIASGVAIGAGLGESARAAVMTRGFAEMKRLAAALGAAPETLSGLSGFGDLALTCTSQQSRNYRFGHALGAQTDFDANQTVEGAATAQALTKLGASLDIDLPICNVVDELTTKKTDVSAALAHLMSRPLKEE